MSENVVDVDLLFETSWEVCNKIGGIYTVLSTKAKTLQKLYKDKVIFIGPDVWSDENPSPYFVESASLLKSWKARHSLPYGITVRVGRWDVPGKPIAILVGFQGLYAEKDSFYGKMWDLYKADSLHAYGDYDEACAFSHAAGIVIESLYGHLNGASKKVIAHFDEWTTGMGLLYVKSQIPAVATIFTTHATSIGRSICGNGKMLYEYLRGYNGDQMAAELNMQSKHSLEKAAAHQADCFTTVSEITAVECEQLLDKKPDIVTPNGFEPNFVPVKSKFKSCRKDARRSLLAVVSALTGEDYGDDTFLVATSGRNEYRNKGLDVFLDAVKTLGNYEPCRKTVAFVLVPAWSDTARCDLKARLDNNRNYSGCLEMPCITHTLHNESDDMVLQRMRQLGFGDVSGSKVTVIYVPCYLNGNDGVFDKSYYDILIGMDATVFPSYYEPWGYTPLESVAFGVPTVTTSLSGFGQWILHSFTNNFEDCGVTVVARSDNNYDAVVDSIARSLKFLTCSDESVLSTIAGSAFATAGKADWKYFIDFYEKAFDIALSNERQRNTINK